MVEKIQKENWTDFDALIATPDMMKSVGRWAKCSVRKGLMPNPKTGTVTIDVAKAVQEVKAGKVEFRTDKTALVHVPVGKISFPPDKLVENATTRDHQRDQGEAVGGQGQVHQGLLSEFDHGPGHLARHHRDRDRSQGIGCNAHLTGSSARSPFRYVRDLKGIETWRLPKQKRLNR